MMAEGEERRQSDGSFHSAQSTSSDVREQTLESTRSPRGGRRPVESSGNSGSERPDDGFRREDAEGATAERHAATRRALIYAEAAVIQQELINEGAEPNGQPMREPRLEHENNQEDGAAEEEGTDDEEDEWEEVSNDDDRSSSDGSEDSSESSDSESDGETDQNATNGVEREERVGPGCAHYRRNCKVVAPCCDKVFWCRHCHNEETESDTVFPHEINRHAVEEVICAACETRQPVSNKCIKCEAAFGKYYCSICKFWDDEGEKKKVYHCDECGICRSGGRDRYFHCPTCNSCYPLQLQNKHTCLQNAMRRLCPVCLEDMFSSLRQSQVLLCGHTIHSDCLRLMQRQRGFQAIRCPMCSKSMADYSDYWKELSDQIERTPMEEHLKRKVRIVCNDCLERSTVDFHFIGLKCSNCNSFNTRDIPDD